MSIFWAIFLGIIQGLTEFIPVSSSGHLVLLQKFIPGFYQPGVLFDVTLHIGTMFSILFYFRKNLVALTLKYVKYIIIASIPAALFGYIFKDVFEGFFQTIRIVSIGFLITGFFNYLTDKSRKRNSNFNLKNSLLIGLAQALAITPGISRSGATISAGSMLGLDKKTAATFSFLLSIPAVVGAGLLEVMTTNLKSFEYLEIYLIGLIFSFISGFFAIKITLKFLEKSNFKYFAVYCIILGVLGLII